MQPDLELEQDDATSTAEAADVIAQAAPFLTVDELPQGRWAYLYTTDPKCTWGKRRAGLGRLPCPLDEEQIRSRWGGGPYEVMIKGDDGRVVPKGWASFALAGPSKLRAVMDDLGDDEAADEGTGGFWDEIRRSRAQRQASAKDDRLDRIERTLEELRTGRGAAPSAADQLMLELAKATIAKATTQQTAGPVGQTLKELLEAQKLLADLNPPREEEGGIMALLAQAFPAILQTVLAPAAAAAPGALPAAQEPRALPAAAAPAAAPQAAPAPTAAHPSNVVRHPAAAAAEGQDLRSATGETMTARIAILVEELQDAIATGESPAEWAAWASDTAGAYLSGKIRDGSIDVDTILALVAADAPLHELLSGPGRAYLETAVQLIKSDGAVP